MCYVFCCCYPHDCFLFVCVFDNVVVVIIITIVDVVVNVVVVSVLVINVGQLNTKTCIKEIRGSTQDRHAPFFHKFCLG